VPVGREDLARLLRQRRELGVESWVLERITREEALAAASGANAAAAGSPVHTLPLAAAPRPGTGATRDSPVLELPDDLGELRELARGCTRCGLAKERTQVVFSDGSPTAQVAVVGEAPGANEDRTGLPFVGAAGKLLDLLLATVDLSREESVYICNVIKCRPPGNRNPLPDEIACCAPYLRKQLELVRPRALLAVGNFAAQLLVGRSEPLGKLRGRVYAYDGTPLVVTYHPAALLRSPSWTRPTWEDLQLLRRVLDESAS
jgi:DNA polymerase